MKIVGLSTSLKSKDKKTINYVNTAYISAIERFNHCPIMLPVVSEYNIVAKQVKLCDAIIMTGGLDINPLQYSKEPMAKNSAISDEMDTHQLTILRVAMEMNIPILCICRGMQLLNVFCGGTLYQDLSYKSDNIIKHNQEADGNTPTHSVDIINSSLLSKIFPQSMKVNSFHHQGIEQLGENITISAVAKDGVIEAVEVRDKKFIIGVQWHPEMMIDKSDEATKLFQLFFNSIK